MWGVLFRFGELFNVDGEYDFCQIQLFQSNINFLPDYVFVDKLNQVM